MEMLILVNTAKLNSLKLLHKARIISNVGGILNKKMFIYYKNNIAKYLMQKQRQRLCRTDIALL